MSSDSSLTQAPKWTEEGGHVQGAPDNAQEIVPKPDLKERPDLLEKQLPQMKQDDTQKDKVYRNIR